MGLHHVPCLAHRIEVAAPLLDPERLGDRDLDLLDIAPVPERFKERVGESEDRNILDRVFAEIMVDTEYLLLAHQLLELIGQSPRRIPVRPERLFGDDTRPRRLSGIESRQLRLGKSVQNIRDKRRGCRHVVQPVPERPLLLLDPLHLRPESFVPFRIGKVRGDKRCQGDKVIQMALKPLFVGHELGKGGSHEVRVLRVCFCPQGRIRQRKTSVEAGLRRTAGRGQAEVFAGRDRRSHRRE
jgi:hypothetical protein